MGARLNGAHSLFGQGVGSGRMNRLWRLCVALMCLKLCV
jgi:hypothetical protein